MFVTAPNLKVRHGFFTRHGGVSSGLYNSLNCRITNRDPAVTELHRNATAEGWENRRRAAAALKRDLDALCVLDQVHGSTVHTLTAPPDRNHALVGDAMVTATRGVMLGVVTADCAPLLFHDPVAGVIGAAHSGWKGTLARIGEATMSSMQALGANKENITVVIGPCIAAESYEVSPEFPAPFAASGRGQFFVPSRKPGHFMFDLKGCIAADLKAAGVGNIIVLPQDTYKDEADFFSNRRAMHRSEPGFGLQLSAISLD